MKRLASIFVLASGLMVASMTFAAHALSQPLTRSECDKAAMHWSEEANVCAEANSTAATPQSSTAFAADISSQPLTRADCDRAGMRWNEGANVCSSEPTSTVGQAQPSPSGTKGSSILIAIDKAKQRMSVFIDGSKKYDWRVSTGRPGYSTPSGTYMATSMNEVWYSKEW